MKVFYWSPFFSNIATIKAVLNSAESLIKYSKKDEYEVGIINSIGEWNPYKIISTNKIQFKDLNNTDISKSLPKGGFFKSRLSYFFIFFFNFFKLLKLINTEKPDYLIIHLITSLPILLSPLFNRKTKIILRLSGLPKLNFLRFILWKLYSKRINVVTCPTNSTMQEIIKTKIFNKEKIYLLKDPILKIRSILNNKNEKLDGKMSKEKYILGIGRLTQQKNFNLLINFFNRIKDKYPEYKLYILGDGENMQKLKKKINENNLSSKVFLLGHQTNVFKYLKYADCFILSSLWEDPGFVLAEAAITNTNIISSDCPNGPKEIIINEDFLFTNGSVDSLLEKFETYKKKPKNDLLNQKINIKKRIKFFTLFQHYKKFNLILKGRNE